MSYLLIRQSLFEMFQPDFRNNACTKTSLLMVSNDLLISNDLTDSDSLFTFLALLDLSAAFDTADNSILLRRLEDFIGIKDQTLNWFSSYLSNCFQFVYVHNNSYVRGLVMSQGSVLGPLIYKMYMLLLGKNICRHKSVSTVMQTIKSYNTQLYPCCEIR